MAAGKTPRAQMVADVQRGALVGRLSMGSPAPNGDFSSVVKNSFLIEDGIAGQALSETMITGNIAPDGSASFYNVIFSMADAVKARSFPMPLPVIAPSAAERDMLLSQPMVKENLALAARADITIIGIGDLGDNAPLFLDGFITEPELKALQKAGAVGEIVGWAFDAQGRMIDGLTNDRVASAPMPSRETSLVMAIAMGQKKLPGIRAALNRRLINGLLTDERTAEGLLAAS